jgi:DNA polymerase III delta subunit
VTAAGGTGTRGAPIVLAWGDDALSLRQVVRRVANELAAASGLTPTVWRADEVRRAVAQDEPGSAPDAAGDAEPARPAARPEAGPLDEIRLRVATASLFGDGVLVAVHDPAGLSRSREVRERILELPGMVAAGNGLVFTELVDTASRDATPATAFRRALGAAVEAAGGRVEHLAAPRPGELEPWIARRAAELDVRLGPGAAGLLAERLGGTVREGDVDRRRLTELADAELSKLGLLRPTGTVSRTDVEALVAPTIPASAWAFLDAVGKRIPGEALRIAQRLVDEGTPLQVVVTQLHRRLRQLLELHERLAAGAKAPEVAAAMKLNPYRVEILARQAAGWRAEELQAALGGLIDVDLATKGIAVDGSRTAAVSRGPLALDVWIAESVARQPGHQT